MPNAITHNAFISACEKGKQPEQALKAFAAMEQQGVVPDATVSSEAFAFNCPYTRF